MNHLSNIENPNLPHQTPSKVRPGSFNFKWMNSPNFYLPLNMFYSLLSSFYQPFHHCMVIFLYRIVWRFHFKHLIGCYELHARAYTHTHTQKGEWYIKQILFLFPDGILDKRKNNKKNLNMISPHSSLQGHKVAVCVCASLPRCNNTQRKTVLHSVPACLCVICEYIVHVKACFHKC